MNWAKIQIVAATMVLPIANAAFIAYEVGERLYMHMNTDISFFLRVGISVFAALCAGIGVEAVGGSVANSATRAYDRKAWTKLAFAGSGLLMYLIGGIGTAISIKGAEFMALFFILVVASHISYAIWRSFDEENEDVKSQAEILKQQRLLVNAETRKVKAENDVPAHSGTKNIDMPEQKDIKPEWLPDVEIRDKEHWRELVESGEVQVPGSVTAAEVIHWLPVGTNRAARNYLQIARNGK